MGMFIDIDIKDRQFMKTPGARGLVDACPVEIFNLVDGQVRVNKDQEDECILCGRCIDIAGRKLDIVKRYDPGGKDDENR